MSSAITKTGLRLMLILAGIFFAVASFAAKEVKSGEFTLSVVELYTSEGCSSCPPADKFLSRLGKTQESEQIVPMAFHVDYWDYIGWKDPYADSKYTVRQHEAGRRNAQASIYTPEFVVDGVEARGSREIADAIQKTQAMPAQADIQLNLSDVGDQRLSITVSLNRLAYQGEDQPLVYLALLESRLSSSIQAGENRGKVLKHDFVVRYLSAPQETEAGKQHQFDLQLDPQWQRDGLQVSVVVRLRDSGETLQALKTRL